MTDLENRIMKALNDRVEEMRKYDDDRKAEYDRYMREAEKQTEECWKNEYIRKANWEIQWQFHGYDFITAWKNVMSMAWFGRIYHEWHSAVAGYRGTGHGAYITSELNKDEQKMIDECFERMASKGYFKISKSGQKATFRG